jgi:cysteine desulfurase/selenocysteine lyase
VAEAMHDALLAPPDTHGQRFDAAHAAIARGLGLPAPERMVLTSSCTQALGVLLGDFAWRPGDTVATSCLEHHALVRPLLRLQQDRGVEHVVWPRSAGGPLDLAAAEASLRTGRVRLVALTGASNVTGELLPLADLVPLAHRHGALVLLDTAQLAGVLPLDAAALGVDALVFAGHKGLQGPLGIGGFWAAPGLPFACARATCEVGGTGGRPVAAAPYPGFCDVGSVNLPAAAGLAAAMAWLANLPAAQRERPRALAAALYAACAARPHCHLLGGTGPRTTTVALHVDGLPLARAERHFLERGLVVRAGQHCAPLALGSLGAPDGCLRISFGPHAGDDDLAAVLAAIDAAAATRA